MDKIHVRVRDDDLAETIVTDIFTPPLELQPEECRWIDVITNALGDGNYDIDTIETECKPIITEENTGGIENGIDDLPHTD